jgi:squalene synthase HpnC
MDLASELDRYGPASDNSPTLEEARQYCRRLAQSHYENFTVVSWLWPRHLHQHLCNVYAYCRWADDLADETANPARSLELLDWWEESLHAAIDTREASHPVFIALSETFAKFDLSAEPFENLLVAFRRDQRQTRYETLDDLLDYCGFSANPVGRIVLKLGRSFNHEVARMSDSICTGLQLANFCQDVKRDFAMGRVYLPQVECRLHGIANEQLAGPVNQSLRALLKQETKRARAYLEAGEPLVQLVSQDLRLPIRLFIDGGLAVVRAIEEQHWDVWSRRPTIGKLAKIKLLAKAWARSGLQR